jgi:hypothetical protein
MGRPTGRPPKPLEEKRLTGNPGKRPLPKSTELVALPPAEGPPAPARPLGGAGRDLWERVWGAGAVWLAERVDAETLLIVCEQMDERQALRVKVLRDGDWRERAGLRALDSQIMDGLAVLGFNPVDRSRLGVAEVRRASTLELLRQRRGTTQSG